jgi:nucleotide-binding universal stress UspA family protein
LRLIHGVWVADTAFEAAVPGVETLFSLAHQTGERILEHSRAVVNEVSSDLDVSTSLQNATPTELLIHESIDARLVVVGQTRAGHFAHLLLGSTAYAIASHAQCPVAVIRGRPEQSGEGVSTTERPVVVGIDGSEVSEYAVELAFEEAAARNAPLVAVHAWTDLSADEMHMFEEFSIPWPAIDEVERRVLSERLAGWSEKYPEVSVTRIVERDRPRDVLLDWSTRAELLVVGSHGRGGFTRMLLGSTSQALIEHADCPVLVARRRANPDSMQP